eukprot:510048_1
MSGQEEQLMLDRVSLCYHELKKLFVMNDEIHEDAIQKLLESYDDILRTNEVNLDKQYNGEQCFIHKLAKQQHTRLIENFIDLGIDINSTSKDGSTAAHFIVQNGDSEITRNILSLLIQHKADLTIENENGFSAMDLCGYKLSRFVQQLQKENPQQVSLYDFNKQDIKNTFDIFDRTKTGYISIAEIKDTIYHLDLGFNVSDNLLDYMFRICDISGDGQISSHEFSTMVKKNINGIQRPIHQSAKLAQLFRKKIESQTHIKNIPLDFIFIPRNIQNNNVNEMKETQKYSTWINVEPTHNLIDAQSVVKIIKKCDLNFTKLERLYQLYFNKHSGDINHTYTTFEDFMKAFKSAENKYKKKLKRLFYSFSEEHIKYINGRLLFICLAGILAQFKTHFMTLDELSKTRADFVFKLLDVNNEGTIDMFQIAWLLRAANLFTKSEQEILRKSQLLLTASGAKGYGERVKKESFNEVVLRFPSIVFIKVV